MPACALLLGACAQRRPEMRSDTEVAALVAHPTADDLATAALVAQTGPRSERSLELIVQAEALAPQRPELLWLHRALCARYQCDALPAIDARLQSLDADNGLVWLASLQQAWTSGSDEALTQAIARIGAAPKTTIYFNQLWVMAADGLAVADPTLSLGARGVDGIGMVAALAIPPLLPMLQACTLEALELPGRRSACEALAARLEQSDTALMQGLSLGMQARWWPADGPQRALVNAKHRRLDYLMTESGRLRPWHMERDVAVRIDAARHSGREEDVELAVMRSFGLPPDPPASWKDPLQPQS